MCRFEAGCIDAFGADPLGDCIPQTPCFLGEFLPQTPERICDKVK